MTDLTERLRASVTYQYMPMNVRKMLSEAATTLETLTQEVERLRGLLIDPGDPAWEDARAVLVDELRKAEMATHADNMAAGHAVQIPSWIALNLIAHSRETLTQEVERLERDRELAIKWANQSVSMLQSTFFPVADALRALEAYLANTPHHNAPEAAAARKVLRAFDACEVPLAPARKALGGGDANQA